MKGQPFNWAEYRGKVVLVDFWATWCGPCLKELPNMQKAYAAYHEQGFEIVGISMDEDRAKLDEFLTKNPLPWTTLHEGGGNVNQTAAYYGISALPAPILVDQNGKVVSMMAQGEELNRLLKQLLGPAN